MLLVLITPITITMTTQSECINAKFYFPWDITCYHCNTDFIPRWDRVEDANIMDGEGHHTQCPGCNQRVTVERTPKPQFGLFEIPVNAPAYKLKARM